MEEVGKTASSLEDRFHQIGTLAEGADLQARRQDQLEQTMELLVNQRREDEQKAQAQARAVDSRFRELERRERAEGSWRIEAQAIRDELEDLRTSRFPAVCQQFTRTAQSLSEGLQALREEVQGQAVSASPAEALGSLGTGDAASLRAEISELRERLLRELSGGLDGRLATLRADVAAEVGSAVLETREAWTAASRRLSALEASAAETGTMRSELRALRLGQQLELAAAPGSPSSSPVAAASQRLALEGASPRGRAGAGRSATPTRRPAQGVAAADGRSVTPRGARVGAAAWAGLPVTTGRRVEWAVPASALAAARQSRAGGQLVCPHGCLGHCPPLLCVWGFRPWPVPFFFPLLLPLV
ncbi:unnamed protein product, partial [Prorocentrum cordatum]